MQFTMITAPDLPSKVLVILKQWVLDFRQVDEKAGFSFVAGDLHQDILLVLADFISCS